MLRIQETGEGREVFPTKWGLLPAGCKDAKLAASAINAKSETVDSKPMLRSAFKSRRCLVVASGFYEWQKITPKEKQPHDITLRSGHSRAFADLGESWTNPEGEDVKTCTICTPTANLMMSPFHDRMPVILPHARFELWLDPFVKDVEKLRPILAQLP